MTVLITLTSAGLDSGPFNLYSNVNAYGLPFQTGVSKASLLAGLSSSLVPDGTTIVRIKSDGACTNYIDVTVSGFTTTTTSTSSTTTTTTTAAPGITFSTATCKTGNCNDNAQCTVHFPINVYNAPVGYYVQMVPEMSAGASMTYAQNDGYAVYTESSGLSTYEVRFDLYNTYGGTIIATTGTVYVSHQSYWSMLNNC